MHSAEARLLLTFNSGEIQMGRGTSHAVACKAADGQQSEGSAFIWGVCFSNFLGDDDNL